METKGGGVSLGRPGTQAQMMMGLHPRCAWRFPKRNFEEVLEGRESGRNSPEVKRELTRNLATRPP